MAYTTINKSTDNFNTKLYTGNGSTNAITGVGFQPDFTWIKYRNSGTYGHDLYDAVRGATKTINSNNTSAEYTSAYRLTAFNSDGFTLGSDAPTNDNSGNFVSWNWKANGAGSANTDGSINTTVSANTTAGFSIVTYTGNGQSGNNTFGHGLGTAPQLIMWMPRSGTTNKHFWSHALPLSGGEYQAMQLNLTASASAFGSSSVMNAQAPTSTVFTLENADYNNNGVTYVAYCFAEKTGYSKFGSYTGNGNTDGTFVYTGFVPSFVMIKRTDGVTDWMMFDNKRTDGNPNLVNKYLLANSNGTEGSNSTTGVDFLSNGFKCINTFNSVNASGGTYIYMAFGQSLVGSNNVPCTAR